MNIGWPRKRISEIASHSLGKMLDKAKNKGEFRPYLRNLNVRWFGFDLSDLTEMRFLDDEEARYTVAKGDLVICEGGYPGRAAIWHDEQPIHFQKALHRVRFVEPHHAKWCLYYLQALDLSGVLKKHFNGAGIQHFTGEALAKFELPIAPLPEQQRIVAILDEAFDSIATAKANAEKNLQNARELFASKMQVQFAEDEAWERVDLLELMNRKWITSHLDGNHGSDYPRKEEFVDAGVPYIAASAIKHGTVDLAEAKYLSPARAASIRKGLAKDRDVLFAHNATVGPVALLNTDEEVVILGTSLTYYRCDPQHVHPEYLAHFMTSPAFTFQYQQVMKQSTRNQVPITKQREFFHVIPPIEVQRRIAMDLDDLRIQTERLREIEIRKLAALDELKKSLLQQAFSGAL